MWKRFWIALLLVPGMLMLTSPDAKAQNKIVSTGETVGAIAGVAGAGAVIAIVVVHEHNVHVMRGCVASYRDGLQVKNEGDNRSYLLSGDTASIKAGERVKLSGKKMKGDGDHRQFALSKLTKDYGPCEVAKTTP